MAKMLVIMGIFFLDLVRIKAEAAGINTPNRRTTLLVDSGILKAIPKWDKSSGTQISHERINVVMKNILG